jgi:flagellar protein FliT
MEHPLLEHYRTIERTSQKMLEAAQADDWDQVVRLESICTVLIAGLRRQLLSTPLEPQDQAEKRLIMQRILQRDADIRVLAEPWLEEPPCWREQRSEAVA